MGRATLALAVVFAAVALPGCGGSSDKAGASETETETAAPASETTQTEPTETTPKPKPPTTITIRVIEGRPEGGVARPTLRKNEQAVLVVRSDVADEVHLHGYDLSKPVRAGGTVRLIFVAELPGRFELELEERGIQLAELTVR